MGPTRREGPRLALDTSGSGRKPGWSTQNQALAAVLVLYEHALERPLTGFIQVGLNILNIGVGINH
jgi:hypothetical protein